jgi:ribosomal protein RSM22 (predicted rRNA methylase)
MFNPLTNQAVRNAEHQQAMQIRNILQAHIRNLLQRVNRRLIVGIDRDERQRLVGELQGYTAIRMALAPTIAPDRYASLIHQAITDLNSTSNFTDESHCLCQDIFEKCNAGASPGDQLIILRRLVSGLAAQLPAAAVDALYTAELREAVADELLQL